MKKKMKKGFRIWAVLLVICLTMPIVTPVAAAMGDITSRNIVTGSEMIDGVMHTYAIVHTGAQLRDAVARDEVTRVYLGANINLDDKQQISADKDQLVIIGKNPYGSDPERVYTYTDRNNLSSDGNLYYGVAGAPKLKQIKFQDIDLRIRNYYGVVALGTSVRGVDIAFENVTFTGSQAVYNRLGSITLEGENTFTLTSNGTSSLDAANELAEVTSVYIGGTQKIVSEKGGHAVIWLPSEGGNGHVEFRDNADVSIINYSANGTLNSGASHGGIYVDKNTNVYFGDNVKFQYKGTNAFFYHVGYFRNVSIGKNSDINIEIGGSAEFSAIRADHISVGEASRLFINLPDNTKETVPLVVNNSGSIVFDHPAEILLYNNGRRPMGVSGGSASFDMKGIQAVTFYKNRIQSSPWEDYLHIASNIRSQLKNKNEDQFIKTFDLKYTMESGGRDSGNTVKNVSTVDYDGNIQADNANLNISGMYAFWLKGAYSPPPEIDPVIEGDRKITGQGIAGSRITVTLDAAHSGQILEPVTVDADGVWNITVPAEFDLLEGDQVAAVQAILSDDNKYHTDSKPTIVTIGANLFQLTGNTSGKIYVNQGETADTIAYGVKADTVKSLSYVILPDPEDMSEETEIQNVADLQRLADSYASEAVKVITVTPAQGQTLPLAGTLTDIEANVKVVAVAEMEVNGISLTKTDTITYRNIYTKSPLYVRGYTMLSGGERYYLYGGEDLYHLVTADNYYGIPYDGEGNILSQAPHGYDKVALKMMDGYEAHWEASLNGVALPEREMILTLGPDFPEVAQGLSDADIYHYSLEYTKISGRWSEDVQVEYKYKDGTNATVDGNNRVFLSVPRDIGPDGEPLNSGKNFQKFGGEFEPHWDSNNTPVGYLVNQDKTQALDWNTAIITDCGNFAEQFDPQIDDLEKAVIYVVYDQQAIQVTEEYLIFDESGEGNHKLVKTGTVSITENNGYVKTSASQAGYIWMGYETSVADSQGQNRYYYEASEGMEDQRGKIHLRIENAALKEAVNNGNEITVQLIFTADSNDNGIPDYEECKITVNYVGYRADGSRRYLLNSLYIDRPYENGVISRKNVPVTITNDGRPEGDAEHAIADGTGVSQWLFDSKNNPDDPDNPAPNAQKRNIKPTGDRVVEFFYDYATDGELPDKRQFVTEHFILFGTEGDEAPQVLKDHVTKYILYGSQYQETPEKITLEVNGETVDYIPYAYYLNGQTSDINEVYVNGQTFTVNFTVSENDQEVTYLYREAAKPANILWQGETASGIPVELRTQQINGYTGETLTVPIVYEELDQRWTFDADASESSVGGDMSGEAITITLDGTEQFWTLAFKELLQYAEITIRFTDESGQIIANLPAVKKSMADEAFSVAVYGKLITASGDYRIAESAITPEFGQPMPFDWEHGLVDPANGNQTINFKLESTKSLIQIRGYDENHNIINTGTITGAAIGEWYAVNAPYIKGYALLETVDGAPQQVLKPILVAEGANYVDFYYESVNQNGKVLVKLMEGTGPEDTEARLIQAYLADVAGSADGTIAIPDLSGAYYSQVSTEAIRYVEGMEFIQYFYEKDLIPVKIEAKKGDETLTTSDAGEKARKGEMYQAHAVTVKGHTVAERSPKTVYADPLQDPLQVEFQYEADAVGNVTVRHYYVTGEAEDAKEIDLSRTLVNVGIGQKLSAESLNLEAFGFVFTGTEENPASQEITVLEENEQYEIAFRYTDERFVVKVELKDADNSENLLTPPAGYDVERRLAPGRHTIWAPMVEGYTMTDDKPAFETVEAVNGGNQTVTFLYSGQPVLPETAEISIRYTDDNGKLLMELPAITKYLTDEPFSVEAYGAITSIFEGYQVKSSTLTKENGEPEDFDWRRELIDPSERNQTVTFRLTSVKSAVIVRSFAGEDVSATLFNSYTVADAPTGPYAVHAPYWDGYVLADAVNGTSQSLIQTVTVDGSTATYADFYYTKVDEGAVPAGHVLVKLMEEDEAGQETGLIGAFLVSGATNQSIAIPNLEGDYYTAVPGQAEKLYTEGMPPVIYRYTKDMLEVTIAAMEGETLIASTVAAAKARKGEMYLAHAIPVVEEYTLAEAPSRWVYAEPEQNAAKPEKFLVEFQYSKDPVGNVEIRHYYIDRDGETEKEVDLSKTCINVGMGQKVSAQSMDLSALGFEFAGDAADQFQEIIVESATETYSLSFIYEDDRYLVTLALEDEEGRELPAPEGFSGKIRLTPGQHNLWAPAVRGYHFAEGETGLREITAVNGGGETVVFRYANLPVPPAVSKITVRYTDEAGSLITEFPAIVKEMDEEPFSVAAYGNLASAFGNYEIASSTIENENQPARPFAWKTTLVDPAIGNQIINFHLTSSQSVVQVNSYDGEDETGRPIYSYSIFDAPAGEEYAVHAPYLEGYVLREQEAGQPQPLIKKVHVKNNGTTHVNFFYMPVDELAADEMLVYLKEGSIEDENAKLIQAYTAKANGENKVAIPDLSQAWYTAVPGQTAKDFAGGGTVTYYYAKRLMPVVIVAEADGETIASKPEETMARMGEMYTAAAIDVAGYKLAEGAVKQIYADPGSETLYVVFQYSKNPVGNVEIRHYYVEDSVEKELSKSYLNVETGRKASASAMALEGLGFQFTEAEDNKQFQEIIVSDNPAENILAFRYTDERPAFRIVLWDDDQENEIALSGYEAVVRLAPGSRRVVWAPHVNGYRFADGEAGFTEVSADSDPEVPVTFHYTKTLPLSEMAEITVRYADENNSVLTEFPVIRKSFSEAPFSVEAYGTLTAIFEGYEIAGSTITKPGSSPVDFDWRTGKVNPADGNQDVTFRLKSTKAMIQVIGYDGDENGRIVHESKIPTATIGQTYDVNAPIVSGYALKEYLADGQRQPLLQPVEVTETGAEAVFYYEPADTSGKVAVSLYEGEPGDGGSEADRSLIQVFVKEYQNGEVIKRPNLSGDYYDYVTAEDQEVVYDGSQTAVAYYYKKQLVDVQITPVDENGLLQDHVVTLKDAARKGEMYLASCDIAVEGYRLAEPSSRHVYANPGENPLVVTFQYEKVGTGDVKVLYYYINEKGIQMELTASYITADEGQTVFVKAIDFTNLGFRLDDETEKSVEVVEGQTPEVSFRYDDVRYDVTVKLVNEVGAPLPEPVGYTLKTKLVPGKHTIWAPSVDGYNLARGEKGFEEVTAVNGGKKEIVFTYTKDPVRPDDTVTIAVRYTDETGTVMTEFPAIVKYPEDEPFSVAAYGRVAGIFDGYEIKASTVAKAGRPPQTFDWKTAAVNPADGDQIVTFILKNTKALIEVRARDTEGIIETSSVSGASVGQTYAVNAPYVDGYVLLEKWENESQPLIKTVEVKETITYVDFYYEKLEEDLQANGKALIYLFEGDGPEDGQARLIQAYLGDIPESGYIAIPDLTGAYYDQVSQEPEKYDEEKGYVRYYYRKQRMDVQIEPSDSNGPIENQAVVIHEAARKGEMYLAEAPEVEGYHLLEAPERLVYADPEAENNLLAVQFQYEKAAVSAVEILYYYENGDNRVILSRAFVKAKPGETVEAEYINFENLGFLLDDEAKKAVTVSADGQGNQILFRYNDARHLISVLLWDDDKNQEITAPVGYQSEIRLVHGSTYTVLAPHVNGYRFAEGEPGSRSGELTDSETVTFHYTSAVTPPANTLVTVTVKGLYGDTALYEDTYKLPKNMGAHIVNARLVSGYQLQAGQPGYQTILIGTEEPAPVVFHYTSTAAVSADVEIEIRLDGKVVRSESVTAETGEPFSYTAPYETDQSGNPYVYEGYTLDGNAKQNPETIAYLESVGKTGAKITFHYTIMEDGALYLMLMERINDGEAPIKLVKVTEEMIVSSPQPDSSQAENTPEAEPDPGNGIEIPDESEKQGGEGEQPSTPDQPSVTDDEASEIPDAGEDGQTADKGEAETKDQAAGETAAADSWEANQPGMRKQSANMVGSGVGVSNGLARITQSENTGAEGVFVVKVPDLSGSDYFEAVRETVEIPAGQSIGYAYYTKMMQNTAINKVAFDTGAAIEAPGAETHRMGEVAAVTAPEIAGWKLADKAVKRILALPDTTGDKPEVTFAYLFDSGTEVEPKITIVVTNASGAVLSGAEVTVTAPDATEKKYQTDENGRIVINDDLAYGSYKFKAVAVGYNASSVTRELSADEPWITVSMSLGTTTTSPGGGSGGGGNGGKPEPATTTITVRGLDEQENVIHEETITMTVGDVRVVDAPQINGYALAADEAEKKTITAASSAKYNIVEFRYTTSKEEEFPPLTDKHIVYINGYGDGTVRPDNPVTRAEVAMMFYQLTGSENKQASRTEIFPDVEAGLWYAQAVNYLAGQGVLTGYPDGTFRPDSYITRSELTVIASRFFTMESGSNTFNDVPASHWAVTYINNSVAKGWVTGYPDGSFRPEAEITRAETVTIINGMLDRKMEAADIPDTVVSFTDLAESHWAYTKIVEASNAHDYERKANGFELWH